MTQFKIQDLTPCASLAAQRADFDKLVASPWDEELRARTQVLWANPDLGGVRLCMWHRDFLGPGGVTKGYLYGPDFERPLVESIDGAEKGPVGGSLSGSSRSSRGRWSPRS